MSAHVALRSRRIFDGAAWHADAAVLVDGAVISGICSNAAIPREFVPAPGIHDLIAPGFIDLQVNGGGGILFNDQPNVEGIRTICEAHRPFGTTTLLPTLITDNRETTRAALAAGIDAARAAVTGFGGIHLEGPHLSVTRRGAHSAELVRPMDEEDVEALIDVRRHLPALMITCAPESVTLEQVARLVEGGIRVSLGHSDCSYDVAAAHVDAGASMVTHLFNAMSPFGHREPGLAGAALDCGALHAGLISDGIHVHPAAMRAALRAKSAPGRIFLVTDAMATIGTDLDSFELNGRHVYRRDGRLTLEDGTLAGADIDMAASVRFAHRAVGLELGEAIAMASRYPAIALGIDGQKGSIRAGKLADLIALDDALEVRRVWQGGSLTHDAGINRDAVAPAADPV